MTRIASHNSGWILIGRKIRTKFRALMQQINIPGHLVSIWHRPWVIFRNKSKNISVKRYHFPMVPDYATTIHSSQGRSFNDIVRVYYYDKSHSQQMVYVALSRFTILQWLYIVLTKSDPVFHNGHRKAADMTNLKLEFRRPNDNRFCTVQDRIVEFIRRNNYIFLILNCQSPRAHNLNLMVKFT